MFDSIGIIKPEASQNRSLDGVGKADMKKIWGVFNGGRYNKSLVQRNKEQGTAITSRHGHGHTFGSNNGGKFTKLLIKYRSLGQHGGERG